MSTVVNVAKDTWILKGGVEIRLEGGPSLYAYKSTIDGKLVVEVETTTEAELPTHVDHGSGPEPDMRIRLNEANLDLNSDLGSDFVSSEEADSES